VALNYPPAFLNRDPWDGWLHFNRAVVLEELKHYDVVELAYQRCIEIDPTHADAHLNLALSASSSIRKLLLQESRKPILIRTIVCRESEQTLPTS
jgi:tetratricopeptide (TPR) repeat protein